MLSGRSLKRTRHAPTKPLYLFRGRVQLSKCPWRSCKLRSRQGRLICIALSSATVATIVAFEADPTSCWLVYLSYPISQSYKGRPSVGSIGSGISGHATAWIGCLLADELGRKSVGDNLFKMSFLRVAAMPLLFVLLVTNAVRINAGQTSPYMRKLQASVDIPENSSVFAPPAGFNAPQQVHITQGDYEGKAVIVSWVTPSAPDVSDVYYGTEKGNYTLTATTGIMTTYTYYNYTSGFIHHAVLRNLEYDTQYFYQLGQGEVAREFSFFTPPASGPDVPFTFGIIGDLGQTFDSKSTLDHYLNSSGQSLLYVGDLSYADDYPYDYNVRWDTWGRFVEPSTAYQAWIWTAGNHEIEYNPDFGETVPFKPFTHRYHTPYQATNSTSSLWYAIQRGPATIIVLSSYSAYGKYTPQYDWLTGFLPTVNRTVTPWLIVLLHSPWYNSNSYHYMEGESMRVMLETFLVEYSVDIVFAGHVHAYERTYPVSNLKYNIINGLCTPQLNDSAPTYVTIGDGGNIEGIAGIFTEPQPAYSAYREASFGHAELEILNRTHALYTWHRNQDGEKVVADSAYLLNKFYK